MSRPTGVFIDGFNLYHGMRDADLGRFLWVDLVSLAESLVPNEDHLAETRYYTARIKRPPESVDRQTIYIDALRAHRPSEIQIIEGFMQYEPWLCRHCNISTDVRAEKRTDVNLAVDMIVRAREQRFEQIVLVSADADQVAAVEAVQAESQIPVIVTPPPERQSQELEAVADNYFVISKSKLKQAQLPPTVITNNGYQLHRPDEWTPP